MANQRRGEFPIADLITGLSAEIREAMRQAARAQDQAVFYLGECSVEVGITWEKTGDGRLEFAVVKLGGGITKQDTQTLSVTLKPIRPDVTLPRPVPS